MYDLLVLSFNQTKSEEINASDILVKALNKYGKKTQKYYHKIWPFINNVYGILYKIYPSEGLGEFECCDDFFEFGDAETSTKNCIISNLMTVESVDSDDCVNIRLLKAQGDILMSVLERIISHSPISTIAFLCRGQSLDKEIVFGTISIKDFGSMLLSGKVKTNICYIIRK